VDLTLEEDVYDYITRPEEMGGGTDWARYDATLYRASVDPNFLEHVLRSNYEMQGGNFKDALPTMVDLLPGGAGKRVRRVYATTSQNSKILAHNMALEGRPVGPRQAAGHIVPSTGSQGRWAAGARSRALLRKYDIDINDAANGIAIGTPQPHGMMHRTGFLAKTDARLHAVEARMLGLGYGRRAIRAALRRELRAIGREVPQ
jgi:hypothetical protein